MISRPRGFEDRLKAALLARLPETPPPTPARSFARRYGVPLAVGAATVAVVAVMTVPGSTRDGSRPADGPTVGPSPSATGAPEIRKDPDGALRFGMPEPGQVPALVDALKKLGVPAVLVPMRPRSQCSEMGGGYRGPQADPEAEVMQRSADGFTVKVDAKTVPPGYAITFTWADYYPFGESRSIGIGVIEASKVPSCTVDYSEGLEDVLKAGSGYFAGEPAGTIRIPLPKAGELPEVVRSLQAQGVSVAVSESKAAAECPHQGGGYRGPQADPEAELRTPKDLDNLKINSKTVPPGYTLVFRKPTDPSQRVGAGVKETSRVTPCEIDFWLDAPSPPN
ncbi:hypothetical protein [Streptomyces sp. A0592]|uniref:hypothetical protein n=1 Tax=Streptomyces sp. A0592 TaxID=2563099 RepID=UPI00109E411A|nr:hypothetical protein [Streptomyces sp. A0592]THA82363.1 hypothetical protein E6U81_19860 [Streptomyces sp. A0592]